MGHLHYYSINDRLIGKFDIILYDCCVVVIWGIVLYGDLVLYWSLVLYGRLVLCGGLVLYGGLFSVACLLSSMDSV